MKELLKEFQNMNAADSNYVSKLKELWSVLGQHIKEEESDDLPALEKALSADENKGVSESLAKNFGRTKMFVPSRSHPSAGETPCSRAPWVCSLLLLTTLPTCSANSQMRLSVPIPQRNRGVAVERRELVLEGMIRRCGGASGTFDARDGFAHTRHRSSG